MLLTGLSQVVGAPSLMDRSLALAALYRFSPYWSACAVAPQFGENRLGALSVVTTIAPDSLA
jgi:hypothetical protein